MTFIISLTLAFGLGMVIGQAICEKSTGGHLYDDIEALEALRCTYETLDDDDEAIAMKRQLREQMAGITANIAGYDW